MVRHDKFTRFLGHNGMSCCTYVTKKLGPIRRLCHFLCAWCNTYTLLSFDKKLLHKCLGKLVEIVTFPSPPLTPPHPDPKMFTIFWVVGRTRFYSGIFHHFTLVIQILFLDDFGHCQRLTKSCQSLFCWLVQGLFDFFEQSWRHCYKADFLFVTNGKLKKLNCLSMTSPLGRSHKTNERCKLQILQLW